MEPRYVSSGNCVRCTNPIYVRPKAMLRVEFDVHEDDAPVLAAFHRALMDARAAQRVTKGPADDTPSFTESPGFYAGTGRLIAK